MPQSITNDVYAVSAVAWSLPKAAQIVACLAEYFADLLPADAPVTCTLTLWNDGAVGLTSLAVIDQPACGVLPDLSPNATASCNVSSRPLAQQDFDSWDEAGQLFTFPVSAAASASQSSGAAGVTADVSVSVALTSSPGVNMAMSNAQLSPDPDKGEQVCHVRRSVVLAPTAYQVDSNPTVQPSSGLHRCSNSTQRCCASELYVCCLPVQITCKSVVD